MNRRSAISFSIAAIAAPSALFAQLANRVYRIAILDDSVESARGEAWQHFRKRLAELGLVEGKNAAFVARYARGDAERLPGLAAQLLALKPDIVVCPGTSASLAAMKAIATIPIVFIGAGDPVGTGLVASLSRPGGNVTGISNFAVEIAGKQLEILREVSPGAKRLAYLTNASNKASVAAFRQAERHARTMHMAIQMLDGRKRAELEHSFETIKREGVQGFIVSAAGPLLEHREQIVQFSAKNRLPVMYGRREYVDAGGLVSYSADFQLLFARGAEYAHQVLQGAKPAEMPVERSSTFRMVLNMKTARALGIRIPDSVRVRADEVIE